MHAAKVMAGAVILLLMVVFAFVWNEARKEIVFLCANFAPGTTAQSVITQLETGSFLRFRTQTDSTGSTIYVDSAFNLGRYRCIVELDQGQAVKRAYTELG